jgi:hypothetical protein
VDMALIRLPPAVFVRGGQVRPPPGGELGCYWRRKLGLEVGAFGLEATPIFFVWADRFFYVTTRSTSFLHTTLSRQSRPIAALLVETSLMVQRREGVDFKSNDSCRSMWNKRIYTPKHV